MQDRISWNQSRNRVSINDGWMQVMLFGANDAHVIDKVMQITVAFNHFGQGLEQRMPRCRWGFIHVLNNDYTHWLMYAIGGSSQPTIISQGNRFIAPPNPNAKQVRSFLTIASPNRLHTEKIWPHKTVSFGMIILCRVSFSKHGIYRCTNTAQNETDAHCLSWAQNETLFSYWAVKKVKKKRGRNKTTRFPTHFLHNSMHFHILLRIFHK